MILSFTKT